MPASPKLSDGRIHARLLSWRRSRCIAAATFRDYGLGWDDYTHSQYGDLLLSLYWSGFPDKRAFSFVNLYMYGGGFDIAAALTSKMLPFDPYATRRLVGAAIGIAGLFVTWRLARRLGGPLAGLIALVLLATCPLYYGHMFMNCKDAPFAVAMVLASARHRPPARTISRTRARPRRSVGHRLSALPIGSRVMGGFAVIEALAALAAVVALRSHDSGLKRASGECGGVPCSRSSPARSSPTW